jgi:DNA polymerase-4
MMEQKDDIYRNDGAGLKWLYVDMNSFFASVEQQDNPRLRGRPVIVVPVMSDYTSAIAASREAKALGVKTGTRVKEAREKCPHIAVIEARPDRYVDYHHRMIAAVDTVLPVEKVCSIDEVACRLMGPEVLENNAFRLGRQIQEAVLAALGSSLTCSIGIAPSRLLAKTAADVQKPLGLTLLRKDTLPGRLLDLPLDDFAGIGRAMKERLNAAGIEDVAQLWALSPSRLRQIWGGVLGDNFFYALHGIDPAETKTTRGSVSHSHVLASALRPEREAFAVARRLTVKCGSRLRRMAYKCAGLHLSVRAEQGGWFQAHRRFAPTADSFRMLEVMNILWLDCVHVPRIKKVSVTCLNLVPAEVDPDMFGWTPESGEDRQHMQLLNAVDRLNQRYGKDAVSIGVRPAIHAFVGAKIAFNRVPELSEFRE